MYYRYGLSKTFYCLVTIHYAQSHFALFGVALLFADVVLVVAPPEAASA